MSKKKRSEKLSEPRKPLKKNNTDQFKCIDGASVCDPNTKPTVIAPGAAVKGLRCGIRCIVDKNQKFTGGLAIKFLSHEGNDICEDAHVALEN